MAQSSKDTKRYILQTTTVTSRVCCELFLLHLLCVPWNYEKLQTHQK